VVRLGQNFLADPNLLAAIARESGAGPGDVVLEVGGGEGALTEHLAGMAGRVVAIELDRGLAEPLGAVAQAAGNVDVIWADAMRLDLGGLDPAPTMMVSNLPYSVATPVILRTIAELPGIRSWTVLVQREIADRLRAEPGSRAYGGPSVLVQLACRARMVRKVGREVFRPRPRVDSAVLHLERSGPAAPPAVVELVRGAFAHRRKTLAGSVELAGIASRAAARAALAEAGLDPGVRAEALAPPEFVLVAERLAAEAPAG